MGKPRKDQPLNKPYYKGGNESLKEFISTHLEYPKEAITKKIEGVVEATYDVNDLGQTKNIEIITSLGFGCDQEVVRLIGLLKYEKAYQAIREVDPINLIFYEPSILDPIGGGFYETLGD